MQPSDFDNVLLTAGVEVPYRRQATSQSTGDLLLRRRSARPSLSRVSRRSDIDGLGVASFMDWHPISAIDLCLALGPESKRWCMDDCHGGASAVNLLQHAIRAIQHGDANVIALVSGDRFEPADFKRLVENYNVTTRTYLRPLENGGPNSLFALLTQRHAKRYGLTRRDYGALCVAQRAWAASETPMPSHRTFIEH